MSCFREGTNHTRGGRAGGQGPAVGRGGRRSQLKARARALLKGQGTGPNSSSDQLSGSNPSTSTASSSSGSNESRNVKRLRSLERIFKDQPGQTPLDRHCNSKDAIALPMKIEYANVLSDNGKFKEALAVLTDILDERHEAKAAQKMSPSSSTQGGPGGLGGVDAGFAEGGEGFNSFSKMGARLCSAPVLCAQDMSGMDDGEQDEADEMTHRAFKHYVNTLAQTTIDLANKSTVYLRQINLNSAKNMQKAVNNQLNSGANKSDVSESNGSNLSEGLTGGSQFVDYKVSAGQITPCPWSCPHCSGVIIEPISLACGHTYCRECMLNMARAANKSHTKRASCLKCGVLWFPLEEPKPSTTKKDPAATPGAPRSGPARPEGQGGEVEGQNNIATPASDQPQPTAATEPIVGPAGVHQDMLFAAAALNQADASKSGPAPPKTPIEAFERLKINVTVQGLVEKYWKNDIQSVAHRQSGNKFFKSNKPAEAIKAYSEAIDLASGADQYSLANRSNALRKQGELEAALRDAERAIHLRPEWAKGYYREGEALAKLGRHEEAFRAMFECLSIERATKVSSEHATREAAKELAIILSEASAGRGGQETAAAPHHAEGETPSGGLGNSDIPSFHRKSPSCVSLSALSVDSGVSSLSSGSSHYSSLTSLASLTAGGGSSSMQPPPPPTSQSQQPRKQSASESSSEATAPKRLAASCVPKVVTELVEYASSMYEKQSKLHTMKKLRSEQAWFLRGVLTYRKPYRSIASEAVDARDYECSLCYRLFWQPVVTACGHTYCKVCLEQALDHNPQCPQCRTPITSVVGGSGSSGTGAGERAANEFVECSMRRLLPKDYEERKSVHLAEIQNIGTEEENNQDCGSVEVVDSNTAAIPVFVCTIAAPNIPCPLHIFEPKYRLMIRRAMESGTRAFGMSCRINDAAPFADYGTMLEIRDVQYFQDGRSVIDTIGGRRFRVLSRSERDGYDTARVEFIQDEMPSQEEIRGLQELHDQVFWFAGRWFAAMSQDFKSGILMHYGSLPEPEVDCHLLPNGPTWIWWLLLILPLGPAVQVQVLSTTSLKRRLEFMAHILKMVNQQSGRM